jgi:hypothetical protein
MADAVFGAAGEVWALILAAIMTPGPYLVAVLVLVAAAGAAFVRGKIAAMIWLPALALAGFLAWRRFHL